MSFVTVRVFQLGERRMIHPPGSAMCEAFHHINQECICETWEFVCEAEYPTDWWLNPTGEMLYIENKYYEVFQV